MLKCYENSWFINGAIVQSDAFHKFTVPYECLFFSIDCEVESGKTICKSPNPNQLFSYIFYNKDAIDIYTDGSKFIVNSKSFVGFAIWSNVEFSNLSFRIHDQASIFTAECLAVYYALDKITQWNNINPTNNKIFRIYSDSESLIKSLNLTKGLTNESPLVVQLRYKMFELRKKEINVKLFWIPSHKGIDGNEKVDSVAKSAAHDGVLANVDIPSSDFYNRFKLECNNNNKEKIVSLSQDKGKFYFNYFYSDTAKPWFYSINAPRKTIVTINRIRSGHTSLNNNLFRFKIVNNDLCKCGKEIDTVEHVFLQCDLYKSARNNMLRSLRKLQLYGPYSIINLLSNLNSNIVNILSEFILNIDINI